MGLPTLDFNLAIAHSGSAHWRAHIGGGPVYNNLLPAKDDMQHCGKLPNSAGAVPDLHIIGQDSCGGIHG